jgi:hypothetical protein
VSDMESDATKAAQGYRRQAEALRKIASEMLSYDKKAAQNLIELATKYEADAARIMKAQDQSSN